LYDDEDDGGSASDDAETRAIAAFLLDRGADPNRHDGAFGGTGLTPLHKAARMGDAQLVRLFLDRGADWNRIDCAYNIPGAHAGTQECRDLLRKYGVEDGACHTRT
jgi:ankyrin repeat protein